jgi:hypothetical protein
MKLDAGSYNDAHPNAKPIQLAHSVGQRRSKYRQMPTAIATAASASRLCKTGHNGEKQFRVEISREHRKERSGAENNSNKFERNHFRIPN